MVIRGKSTRRLKFKVSEQHFQELKRNAERIRSSVGSKEEIMKYKSAAEINLQPSNH